MLEHSGSERRDPLTSDSDNAGEQLPEVGEYWRAAIGLHTAQIATGIQISDCERSIKNRDD